MTLPAKLKQTLLSIVTHGHDAAEGAFIDMKVVPNASRTKVAGILGDRLKVSVAAPPEDGKANVAVCQLLAKVIGVPVRDVTVTAGHTQQFKRVNVSGVDAKLVVDALLAHLA